MIVEYVYGIKRRKYKLQQADMDVFLLRSKKTEGKIGGKSVGSSMEAVTKQLQNTSHCLDTS